MSVYCMSSKEVGFSKYLMMIWAIQKVKLAFGRKSMMF